MGQLERFHAEWTTSQKEKYRDLLAQEVEATFPPMEQDYNDACADFNDAMIEYNASLAQLKDPVTGEVSLEALKDVVKPVSSLGATSI